MGLSLYATVVGIDRLLVMSHDMDEIATIELPGNTAISARKGDNNSLQPQDTKDHLLWGIVTDVHHCI